jgi:hypothetical protein
MKIPSIFKHEKGEDNKKKSPNSNDQGKPRLSTVNCSVVGRMLKTKNLGEKDKDGKSIPHPCIFCKLKHSQMNKQNLENLQKIFHLETSFANSYSALCCNYSCRYNPIHEMNLVMITDETTGIVHMLDLKM